MTKDEVRTLLAMIDASYPNFNPSNIQATVNVWHMALDEYDASDVGMAFKAYLKTNSSGFAPAPGQLIALIAKINSPAELNEAEAWRLVEKAISNSTYNSATEFAKLPPLVQSAVGGANVLRQYAMTEDFNPSFAQAEFCRVYRQELAKSEQQKRMPKDVRAKIESCRTSYLAQIGILEPETNISSLTDLKSNLGAFTQRTEVFDVSGYVNKVREQLGGV